MKTQNNNQNNAVITITGSAFATKGAVKTLNGQDSQGTQDADFQPLCAALSGKDDKFNLGNLLSFFVEIPKSHHVSAVQIDDPVVWKPNQVRPLFEGLLFCQVELKRVTESRHFLCLAPTPIAPEIECFEDIQAKKENMILFAQDAKSRKKIESKMNPHLVYEYRFSVEFSPNRRKRKS